MADAITTATRDCLTYAHIDEMPKLFASLLILEPTDRRSEPDAIKAVTSAWAHLFPDRAAALGLGNVDPTTPRLADSLGNKFVLTSDPEADEQCATLAARLLGARVVLIAEKRTFDPKARSCIMDLARRLPGGLTAEETKAEGPSLTLYRDMTEQLSAFGQALSASDWFGNGLVSGMETLRSHPQVAELMGALPNTAPAVGAVAVGARAEAAGSNVGARPESPTRSGVATGGAPTIPETL